MFLAETTAQHLGRVHDFLFSCISMLQNTKLPYGGISFWTLYCGIFYFTIVVTLIRMILGLGGGGISGGNLLGLGTSVANLKGAIINKKNKEKEKQERAEARRRSYYRH